MTDFPTSPEGQTPDMPPVAAPDISTEQPTTPIGEAEEQFEAGLPAPDAETTDSIEEHAQTNPEVNRADVLATLDDMSAKLAELRSKFETPADQEPLSMPVTETTAPAPEVAEHAAGMIIAEATQPTAEQAEPVADLTGRGGKPLGGENMIRVQAPETPADASYDTAINQAGAIADAQAQTLGANPRPFAGERIEPSAPPSGDMITEVPTFDTATPAPSEPEAPQPSAEA